MRYKQKHNCSSVHKDKKKLRGGNQACLNSLLNLKFLLPGYFLGI